MANGPDKYERWRPGLRQVECDECGKEFAEEDGPICPHCDYDHSSD